mmetsp:Transcript_31809/g.84697  ORF Transcript_31809/g.84697 Transcript_31809/m.84697 type:complete len:214 (+) Transcript_31809:732-1373(+)
MPSLSACSMLAPFSSKIRTTSVLPSKAAHIRGVTPPVDAISTFAPCFSIKCRTTSACPAVAPSPRTVRPELSVASTFAPFSAKKVTMSKSPFHAALAKAVLPFEGILSSNGAPCSTRLRISSTSPCTTAAATTVDAKRLTVPSLSSAFCVTLDEVRGARAELVPPKLLTLITKVNGSRAIPMRCRSTAAQTKRKMQSLPVLIESPSSNRVWRA